MRLRPDLFVRPRPAGLGAMLCWAAACLVWVGPAWGVGRNAEVVMSEAEYARLDTFEAHSLSKADKVFPESSRRGKPDVKKLRAAAAAYDAFVLEFPRSKAVPYALLRKGRCLHLEEKRHEAIKSYTEILDYFPNNIPYASAALYYIGECHWQNGDEDEALKAWAEMAEDVDYSQSRFAATAINKLADALAQRDQRDRAVKYWRQLALDFRNKNATEANEAIKKVVHFHVRVQPNESELRKFYEEVRGFGSKPEKVPAGEDLLGDGKYWGHVRSNVWRHGRFEDDQDSRAKQYFAYWAKQLEGRFPKDDGYQLDLAGYRLRATGDKAAWIKAVDAQYKVNAKPDDFGRVIRWIRIYRYEKAKVDEYYQKLEFSKMKYDQIRDLVNVAFGELKNPELGMRVFKQIRLGELDDPQLVALARSMWSRSGEAVERVCAQIDDNELGKMEMLRFYADPKLGDPEKGIALAEECVGFPDYANEAYWLKATMHQKQKQFPEAIAAYQSYRPEDEGDPANLFAIADCYFAMGKLNAAVQQLEEVEMFFEKHASSAALKIAVLYQRSKLEDKYIAKLRVVLSKYPDSSQSRDAHHRLEKMGLSDIIGGSVKDPDS